MMNGVLVERSIEDVLPTLKTNSDGLKQVLAELLKQYKAKQADLDNWKVRSLPYYTFVTWKTRYLTPLESAEKEPHPSRATIVDFTTHRALFSSFASFLPPVGRDILAIGRFGGREKSALPGV